MGSMVKRCVTALDNHPLLFCLNTASQTILRISSQRESQDEGCFSNFHFVFCVCHQFRNRNIGYWWRSWRNSWRYWPRQPLWLRQPLWQPLWQPLRLRTWYWFRLWLRQPIRQSLRGQSSRVGKIQKRCPHHGPDQEVSQ